MSGPRLERTALASAESLAGALLSGHGPVAFPEVPGRLPAGEPARIPATAFGTTSASLAGKLERVLTGEGLVVTTGQQPVLFLGPLYVLYKALSAIAVAEELESRLDVPVVPVFWIASDDHDLDEIGRTSVLDSGGELHALELDREGRPPGRPVGPMRIGAVGARLADELSQLLPPSEFRDSYLTSVRDAYESEATVSGAFAAALADVLEGREYAWLDAAHPDVKTASAPLFREMLSRPRPVLDALEAGDRSLAEAGFEPPIMRIEAALPLFHDDGEGRERVIHAGADEGFRAGSDAEPESADRWIERLATGPARFSPNVSSRPVLESWLMPVAATVLGPGEIAYWSQLVPLFDHFDVPFPGVVPRASFVAIEARIGKALDQLGVDASELADGGDEVAARVTASSRPGEVADAISSLRAAIGRGVSEVGDAVAAELPGLRASVGKTGKALQDAVTELDRAVDAAVRERQEVTLGRVAKAAAALWPARRPQERILSPFYFLSRYGDAFVEQVAAGAREHVRDCLATPTRDG